MQVKPEQVFNKSFAAENSYVDWAMRLDGQAVFEFLRDFYSRWPEFVSNLGTDELVGGLKALSYSCGFQWRVFHCGNSTSLNEKMELLRHSGQFFLNFLSQRSDLEEICFMWWDDLGVYLSPSEEEDEDADHSVLADRLFELLVHVLEVGNERAQLSAIHGLACLDHSDTRHVLSLMSSSQRITSRVQDALNSLLT